MAQHLWSLRKRESVRGRKREISFSQRRVTFHLPDGSQESCSDSGLGDHEPVGSGSLLTQPLPLVQAQDDFYEQASPDKRTEADGNSDPNSGEL
ncbi:Protocadherin-9 [Dissostichus eleginoides]|uniref:Protocadherin-9 n=1 Tax=Dissostichus eleginoides TaxID=100907 RepID=A0AAD9BX74_DISEL|nr:Protocadherin-9 [Dissostichus eleginoides]